MHEAFPDLSSGTLASASEMVMSQSISVRCYGERGIVNALVARDLADAQVQDLFSDRPADLGVDGIESPSQSEDRPGSGNVSRSGGQVRLDEREPSGQPV